MACLVGGVVLGAALFLSYGLVAGGLVPIVVAVLVRRWTPLVAGAVGALAVVGLFALGGFWWLDGYEQVKVRYYQVGEYGLLRPYEYWVWANLAAFVLTLGPAVVAGLRRLAWWPRRVPLAVLLLVGAVLLAVAAADVSGLSKAEVERISAAVRDLGGAGLRRAAGALGAVVAPRPGRPRDHGEQPALHRVVTLRQRTAARSGSVANRVMPSANDTRAR